MWDAGFVKRVGGAYAAVGALLYAHNVLSQCHGLPSPAGAVLVVLLAPAVYLVSTGSMAARLGGRWALVTAANSALAAALGGTFAVVLFSLLERFGPACAVAPPCKGCVARRLLDPALPLAAAVAVAFVIAPAVGWVARRVDGAPED